MVFQNITLYVRGQKDQRIGVPQKIRRRRKVMNSIFVTLGEMTMWMTVSALIYAVLNQETVIEENEENIEK